MSEPVTIAFTDLRAKLTGDVPLEEVRRACSFYKTGFQFTHGFRNTRWSGRECLLTRPANRLPTGLVPAVIAAVESTGQHAELVDLRSPPAVTEQPYDLSGITLRDYQERLVQSVKLPGSSPVYRLPAEQAERMDARVKLPERRQVLADVRLPGRGIWWAATGSGKTEAAIALTKRLGVSTLFVVRGNTLVDQTRRRYAERLGLPLERVGRVAEGMWEIRDLTVAGIDTLATALDDPAARRALKTYLESVDLLVADECFPSGTLVGGIPVENLRPGDEVPSYDEHTGLSVRRRVVRTFTSRPSALVRVVIKGRPLTCTPGHPFLTRRGWVAAGDLTSRDVVRTVTRDAEPSMRPLRRSCPALHYGAKSDRVLRGLRGEAEGGAPEGGSSSLRELRDQRTPFRAEGAGAGQARKGVLHGGLQAGVDESAKLGDEARHQPAGQGHHLATHEGRQSHARPGGEGQDGGRSEERRELASGSARGQREAPPPPAADAGRGPGVGDGGSRPDGEASRERLPAELQGGPGQPNAPDRCGGGRGEPLREAEAPGREEGRPAPWARVDRVEILQPTGDGTFGGVCPDGLVHNIQVEDTETYVVDGRVVHNCHHAGAKAFYRILTLCPAYYRIAMSGTPLDRTDGANLKLIAAFGEVLERVPLAEIVEKGYAPRARIRFIRVEEPRLPDDAKYQSAYRYCVVDNTWLTSRIAREVFKAVEAGKSVLVIVEQIRHGKLISDRVWKGGKPGDFVVNEFVHGKDPLTRRDEVLDKFRAGKLPVLIASGIFGTGIDVPNFDVVVNAAVGKSPINALQRIGRGMRGDELTYIEFAHFTQKFLLKHSLARLRLYQAEGCFDIEVVR